MAELQIIAADGGERTLPLAASAVSIGRADECDVTIVEQRASRHHCTIQPFGKGWRVVDDQSSNGTWLGGKPVIAAQLQPGDEIEIGQTLIIFEAEAQEVRPQRQPRKPRQKKVPWGMLALPVLLAGGAYTAVGAAVDQHTKNAQVAWQRFAEATVERADLAEKPAERRRILKEAKERLRDATGATIALGAIDRALAVQREGAPETGGDPADPDATVWERAIDDYSAGAAKLTPAERLNRLSRLLQRHGDSAAAVERIRDFLLAEERAAAARETSDRERVAAEAARAAEDGRLGDAIDLWDGWLLRAPPLTRDEERALAETLATIREKGKHVAGEAMLTFEELIQAGKEDEARQVAEETMTRIRGTGYDAWMRGRSASIGTSRSARLEGGEAASTRERAMVMRLLTKAGNLARLRQFAEAAAVLEAAVPDVGDEFLRGELSARGNDLSCGAAALTKVLEQVRATPERFGAVEIEGKSWRVIGGTSSSLLLARGRDTTEDLPVQGLPAAALAAVVARASLASADLIPAALLLHELGAVDAYTAVMRRALADDSVQGDASYTHARVLKGEFPDGGYVPDPEGDGIITYDDYKAILNRAEIVRFTVDLDKVVAKLVQSKQYKGIERVEKAYAELEATRNYALELIMDEVKYFYPYRDRMAEYSPVSHEVDKRVAKVREAWAHSATSDPKTDSKLTKLYEQLEDLRVEIEYLGGDIDAQLAVKHKLDLYLDRGELTVQTYFGSEGGYLLREYNRAVMAKNAIMETIAIDPERDQVRITNDYRMMFGHRRAVRIHDQLVEAARGHSEDMSRLGFFAHESPVPGKRTPGDRVKLAGYPLMGAGENIASVGGSPLAAHTGWIHSSGHHRNLLNPDWSDLGSGVSGRNWTQNFGFQAGDEQFKE